MKFPFQLKSDDYTALDRVNFSDNQKMCKFSSFLLHSLTVIFFARNTSFVSGWLPLTFFKKEVGYILRAKKMLRRKIPFRVGMDMQNPILGAYGLDLSLASLGAAR